MTIKEKPLAGAGQAQKQRVSNKANNLYPQSTHSSPAGQGKQSFNNPSWSQGKRFLSLSFLSLSFLSPTSKLFLISGFVVKSARREMRYCYHDRFYQQKPIHGMHCGPVKNAADKCICNRWSMLVCFEDGTLTVVGKAILKATLKRVNGE